MMLLCLKIWFTLVMFSKISVTKGYLNEVPVKGVKDYEAKLYELLENKYSEFLARVESGLWEDLDVETLKSALEEMKR